MDFLRAAKWDVNDAAKNVKSDSGEGNGDDFVPDEKPKGPSIYDVRQNFGILDPSPLVRIWD